MSSHSPGSRGPRAVFPFIGGLVHQVPGARTYLRLVVSIFVIMIVVLVGFGIARSRRVAEFAPVTVVDSHEPLQELPIRAAQDGDAVEPAHTYDAMLDLSNLDTIVLGVDLDYVLKGLPRYDAVIRNTDGKERFRGRIKEDCFKEGRFMLRLLPRRFPAGDYTLDIEGFADGSAEGRIIASSWFQILR